MSERHPLASPNSWVELRDPRELKMGDKKKILRGITDVDAVVAAGLEITDGLIALLVVNWQLPMPLPLPSVDPKVLDMLEIEDGDALTELVRPAQQLLFPKSAEPKTVEEHAEAVADPASPTTPSAA